MHGPSGNPSRCLPSAGFLTDSCHFSGEDYDGGGGCVKYTNKWAERLGAEGEAPEQVRSSSASRCASTVIWGGTVSVCYQIWLRNPTDSCSCSIQTLDCAAALLCSQWGDKWTESFKDGKGSKHGEVWTAGRGGERYNRWWNEEHLGNGCVRKYGNSTSGEYWDNVEQMDTYYNPIPHFGWVLYPAPARRASYSLSPATPSEPCFSFLLWPRCMSAWRGLSLLRVWGRVEMIIPCLQLSPSSRHLSLSLPLP